MVKQLVLLLCPRVLSILLLLRPINAEDKERKLFSEKYLESRGCTSSGLS
jgi:hypothetical protein